MDNVPACDWPVLAEAHLAAIALLEMAELAEVREAAEELNIDLSTMDLFELDWAALQELAAAEDD